MIGLRNFKALLTLTAVVSLSLTSAELRSAFKNKHENTVDQRPQFSSKGGKTAPNNEYSFSSLLSGALTSENIKHLMKISQEDISCQACEMSLFAINKITE